MSLSLALNNALSGLRVNQQSINVLSQNIANVNTVGYSRQILSQSAVNIEGVGSGVKIDDITRKIDKYLQRSVQTQGAASATAATISDYYQRIQALLGQPGAGNSLDAFVTSFFNSVQQLAETPETTSLKSNAISSGVALAKQISDLALNVQDLRFEADSEMSIAVDAVNSVLDRLQNINKALTQAHALGQSTAGLLDERDKGLRELSEYVSLSVTYQESGVVSVVGGDGFVLLEDGVRHQLHYVKAQSINDFLEDRPLSPLQVLTFNDSGQQIGTPLVMVTGGKSSTVQNRLLAGKLSGLQQMRDAKFPEMLQQIDELAAKLRDNVNAIHNDGAGFPPATTLTGDRAVRATDQYSWSGTVRIAVLQSNGKPVPSPYADESYTGIRPLLLDLSTLNSGQGAGKPTLQTIVDEINNHFGAPGNKAKVGNLNNIQLVSDTNLLPSGATSLFNFDLDLDNISDETAQVFVTNITVLDDTATNITNVTQAAPTITLQSTGTYTTVAGSDAVTINLSAVPNGLAAGDTIYLNGPAGAVNGIPAGDLTGFFTVSSVSGNLVTFTAGSVAAKGGAVDEAGISMTPPYQKVAPGVKTRTAINGELQVDLTSAMNSTYYDVTVDVTVVGADGVAHTAPITYRVANNQWDLMNKRYNTIGVGGAGTLELPISSQEVMRAILVDANGNELPKANGKYVDGEAYLKIIGGNSGTEYGVAIDELDSQQLGKPDGSPAETGTNRGFSHYFGLNNFFESYAPTKNGDSLVGSAANLRVQSRLVSNANLISVGNITQQAKSAETDQRIVYAFALYSGDNSVAQRLGKLNSQLIAFSPAGGLPATQLSLQSYGSEILGHITQRTAEATENASNAKTLYDGFKSKLDAISGVNLDEELANTVVFQNAYSATARVITVVNKMYEDLLGTF